MARSQNPKKHFSVKLRYLVLFLILLALLLAAVGTVAWMRYIRSLQTVTLVQVTSLSLVGPDENTLAIELGDLDVSGAESKDFVFGVKSVNLDKCTIQLAHTTNIPFQYEIYKATKNDTSSGGNEVLAAGSYFSYGEKIKDKDAPYLNGTKIVNGTKIALQGNDHYFTSTYQAGTGSYGHVQENAAPLYWKSGNVTITEGEPTYFILRVIWGDGLSNNKETDMVYLTVGTAIDTSEGGA